YQSIEHIIIDGGSKDRTLDIIDGYRDNIEIVVSEKDNGIYNAMNKGVKMASGDIVGILNSDDVYHTKNTIQKVASELQRSKADAVYGDLFYVNEDDSKIIRNWKSGSYKHAKFRRGWMPPHPTF